MNNRFKFRVWGIEEKKYLRTWEYELASDGELWTTDGSGSTYLPEFYTIEQCTGLKDKNGNLIYENDIVRFHWTEMSPQEFIVKWNNSKKCFDFCEYKNKKRGSRFYYWWECFKTGKCDFVEIIGNIHEKEKVK